MAKRWGLTEASLTDPQAILPAGESLGRQTAAFYRDQPIGQALGFHFASEVTSEREFILCYHGLARFPAAYGVTGAEDPTLDFYRIHTTVEPMHGATSLAAIHAQAAVDPTLMAAVTAGAMAFMDGYGALFAALDAQCYGMEAEGGR